jgi:hypothetical protein
VLCCAVLCCVVLCCVVLCCVALHAHCSPLLQEITWCLIGVMATTAACPRASVLDLNMSNFVWWAPPCVWVCWDCMLISPSHSINGQIIIKVETHKTSGIYAGYIHITE